MKKSLLVSTLAAAAVSLVTVTAAAQSGGDVVKLKNGAIYKGTISELVPNDHVDIVLLAGGSKHFAMSEVEYAGPDKSAAPPATGAPVGQTAGATLNFRAEGDKITLHQVTGSAYGVIVGYRFSGVSEEHSFRSLCTSPCTAALAPGTYELGLSEGEGKPVIGGRVVVPAGTHTLRGEYTSRTGTRVAGYIVLGVSIPVGIGMMLYALFTATRDCSPGGSCSANLDTTMLFAGVGITIVGSIVGSILASRPDKANIEIVPGVAGWTFPRMASLSLKEGAAVLPNEALPPREALPPPGLSLRLRY